jgi:hypothetical protein
VRARWIEVERRCRRTLQEINADLLRELDAIVDDLDTPRGRRGQQATMDAARRAAGAFERCWTRMGVLADAYEHVFDEVNRRAAGPAPRWPVEVRHTKAQLRQFERNREFLPGGGSG